MYLKDCMTSNPITVTPDTPALTAKELMSKHKVRHLPVVTQEAHLLGLVTDRGLLQATSALPPTYSMHERDLLMARITVADALIKDFVSAPVNMPVEEAAGIMREKKIGSLLVTDGDKLVGIATQTDMLDALAKLFGLRQAYTRLVVETKDQIGALATIAPFFKERGIGIINVLNLEREPDRFHLVLRLSLDNIKPLLPEVEKLGFKVISAD